MLRTMQSWTSISLALLLVFSNNMATSAVEPNPIQRIDPSICASPNAINGTSGDDTIVGTSGDDIICSGSGNDSIEGNGGNDTILSGSGNDVIHTGSGVDQVDSGSGNDTVTTDQGDDSIWTGEGNDTVEAGSDDDFVESGNGNDWIFGGEGVDSILAGSGNDNISGGAGGDELDAGSGVDYCERDAADIQVSCYFDNKPPKVSDFSVSPSTRSIDTSSSSAPIRYRFAVTELGTFSLYFSFVRASVKAGEQEQDTIIQTPNFNRNSSSFPTCIDGFDFGRNYCRLASPTDTCPTTFNTFCIVGFNQTKVIFEFSTRVQQNSYLGRYVLGPIYGRDAVGNRLREQTDQRGAFVQTGTPYKTKPTITDLRLVNGPQLNRGDDFLRLSFKYTSAAPLKKFRLGVLRINGSTDYVSDYFVGSLHRPKPTEVSNDSPEDCEATIRSSDICLRSGSANDGVYEVDFRPVGYGYQPYNFTVDRLFFADKWGNEASIKDTNVYRNNYFVDRSSSGPDNSKPLVSKVSISKSKINTGAKEQRVTVEITYKDAGVGFSVENPQVTVELCLEHVSEFDYDCIVGNRTKSKGFPKSILVTFEAIFPAHARRGRYLLNTRATDVSGNMALVSSQDLKSKRMPYLINNG